LLAGTTGRVVALWAGRAAATVWPRAFGAIVVDEGDAGRAGRTSDGGEVGEVGDAPTELVPAEGSIYEFSG